MADQVNGGLKVAMLLVEGAYMTCALCDAFSLFGCACYSDAIGLFRAGTLSIIGMNVGFD